MPALAFFAVLALGGGVFYYFYQDEPPQSAPVPRATSLREKRILKAFPRIPRPAVFDPAQFKEEETRLAYEAARDNPDLLEKLPCYCGCFQQGHSSNYDCFVDSHGASCELCRNIALTAQKLRKEGQKDDQILTQINERYSR